MRKGRMRLIRIFGQIMKQELMKQELMKQEKTVITKVD